MIMWRLLSKRVLKYAILRLGGGESSFEMEMQRQQRHKKSRKYNQNEKQFKNNNKKTSK